MLNFRVIPILTILNNNLVKTKRFKNPSYIGDPINTVSIFNDKKVDEIVILDIGASQSGASPNLKLIEDVASECFMPMTYGGGIKTIEDAARIFDLGVEKICIQSAAFDNPQLLSDIADRFGNQSLILSLDIKRGWTGKKFLYSSSSKQVLSGDWVAQAKKLVNMGVGELLLNSVDCDGLMLGPDLSMIEDIRGELSIPLIASGGVSSVKDISSMLNAGADAVAAGAFFVYYGPHKAVLITYPNLACLKA